MSNHNKIFKNIFRNIGTLQKFPSKHRKGHAFVGLGNNATHPVNRGEIYRSAELLVSLNTRSRYKWT